MKRLTLDKTWTECLRMWKSMIRRLKKDPDLEVEDLKEEWLDNNGFKDVNITHNCFFCEYVWKREGHTPCPDTSGSCVLCPTRKISPNFSCTDENHHYNDEPLAFYAKLASLNRKRKRKAKK